MINEDRIVSVLKTDLLTLYGNILVLSGKSVNAIEAGEIGQFSLADPTGTYIASEPVDTINLTGTLGESEIYFIPDYSYRGIKDNGTPVDTDTEVSADGETLYKIAITSGGVVSVAKAGF